MQAIIPDWNTELEPILETSTLQKTVIKEAIKNMKDQIAASRGTTTGLIKPTAGEIAEA
jgi:hypothetical protein